MKGKITNPNQANTLEARTKWKQKCKNYILKNKFLHYLLVGKARYLKTWPPL